MSGEYEYIKRADIMEVLTSADMQRTIKTGDGAEAYKMFLDIIQAAEALKVQVVRECRGVELWAVGEEVVKDD